MGCPWDVHGLSMGCPQVARGLPMGWPWAVRGLPMVDHLQLPMDWRWAAHEMSMGCPWVAHRLSAGCPWAARFTVYNRRFIKKTNNVGLITFFSRFVLNFYPSHVCLSSVTVRMYACLSSRTLPWFVLNCISHTFVLAWYLVHGNEDVFYVCLSSRQKHRVQACPELYSHLIWLIMTPRLS